jgi:glycosyltransferase involved in cell wall biosynthesis
VTAPPEISVVVTTINRRELLKELLDSLARQTASGGFEVVVVDDGSTDGSAEMLGELELPFQLTVVEQTRAGQSAARNAGAARSSGRVLLFLDDDETAEPQLVEAHLRAHRRQRGIAGVGVIRRRVPPDADRLARFRAENAAARTAEFRAGPISYLDAYGGNSSVERTVFDAVGGYAADLMRETDFEFAYRLHAAGVQFVFIPDAVVTEYRTKDWRGTLADIDVRGRLAVELYRRHPPIVSTMELGGRESTSRRSKVVREVLLALRISPAVCVRVGLVLPGRWAKRWFRFALNYCYWRGVRKAVDPELWKRSRRGTAILRYHAIGDRDEGASRYVVPADRFARQLAWLRRRRYNVISLADYLGYRSRYEFPPTRSVVITFDDGYADNDAFGKPVLERFAFPATIFLLTGGDGLNAGATDRRLVGRPLLDLERARTMLGARVDFGAHTRTHPDLTALEPAAAEDEIAGSKEDLERALETPIVSFAYPFGDVTPEIRELVRRSGFLGACGVKPGHNRPATDSFDLRRLEVRGTDSLLRFALTLVVGEFRHLGRSRS